jgi:DNA-binding NarL/FixJ family response regulator
MAKQDRPGGRHLARKSEITRGKGNLMTLTDILVIEDEPRDAERIAATLRLLIGYDLGIRIAATISSALDEVLQSKPQVVLLDDALKPADTADQTIPFLRRGGYDGPIVVISGEVTRRRRMELMNAGAAHVIHKDEVDSVRLSETLQAVLQAGKSASGTSQGEPPPGDSDSC